MSYRITKTYGHELGLSSCFRQPRAKSHCRFLHGYALSFKFTIQADVLDENNWVLDFGSLRPLKEWLCDNFDHKLLVAADDPMLSYFRSLHDDKVADLVVVPAVGCEAFARMAWGAAERLALPDQGVGVPNRAWLERGVRLVEVEVREHGANSAVYTGEDE